MIQLTRQKAQELEKTNSESYKVGQQLLSLGKVGCLLVSGGQGTRLGLLGPKGCCPITAVRGKTLFQYFEDRLNAACQQAGQNLKMAIMTSFENNDEVIKCFEGSDRVQFFMQGQLPFKSETGETLPFLALTAMDLRLRRFSSPLLDWNGKMQALNMSLLFRLTTLLPTLLMPI